MGLVRIEQDGDVAELVLALPPVNQFSVAFLEELRSAVAGLPTTTRVVLLTSDVPGIFAAGGDIHYMASADLEDQMNYVQLCQQVYTSFEDTRFVSIAAIDGACLAGGLELALGCDIRIAGESAVLGLPEVRLGILPGGGAIHRLVRAIGQGASRDMLLTGRRISGREAFHLGLVSRIAPDGNVVTEARRLAQELANGSPEAISSIKGLALSASEDVFTQGLADEFAAWRQVRATPNAQEGLMAFVEKRAPVFGKGSA